MPRSEEDPVIPDGTRLTYEGGAVSYLYLDVPGKRPTECWTCRIVGSLPLNDRGEVVVVFNRKPLFSKRTFTVTFNGKERNVQLVAYSKGPPR